MTGLAQKFGAVVTHVRMMDPQKTVHSTRIPAGETDVLIACDLVVSAGDDTLSKLASDRTTAVVNDFRSATSEFIHSPDLDFPTAPMKQAIAANCKENDMHCIKRNQARQGADRQ